MADATFRALVKTVTRTLKEEKDPETKEVTGYYTETRVQLSAIDLDDDSMAALASLQGEGELVIEVSRRQRVLFQEKAAEPARQ